VAKPRRPTLQAALATWKGFNDYLRGATEEQAKDLLDAERAGPRRTQYLVRAHSRFNKQRGQRERAELLKGG
jgi:hypothetical protein